MNTYTDEQLDRMLSLIKNLADTMEKVAKALKDCKESIETLNDRIDFLEDSLVIAMGGETNE